MVVEWHSGKTYIYAFRIQRVIKIIKVMHLVKGFRVTNNSCPYFPILGWNTERQSVSLRIQSECWKMQTRITQNPDTFHALLILTRKITGKVPWENCHYHPMSWKLDFVGRDIKTPLCTKFEMFQFHWISDKYKML